MKRGLSNPIAAAAILSTPASQKTFRSVADTGNQAIKFGFFVGKVAFVSLVGYFAYKKIFKGFKQAKGFANLPKSSISDITAKARAEAIYTAMLGVGANKKTVLANLKGLNDNGFIKLFNAFGKRRGATFTSMNLVEWLQDQFKESEMAEFRFVIPGHF